MSRAIEKYRRQVIHAMRCSRSTKKSLLCKLDALLKAFQDEYPEADEVEVLQAFGSPYEMAETLCEEVSDKDRRRFKRNHRIRICACILLCIIAIALISAHVALQTDPAPIQVIQEWEVG